MHPSSRSALLALLDTGTLADVALAAGEDDGGARGRLPAHRAVLAAGSGYFAALFTGAFAADCGGGGAGGGPPPPPPPPLPVVRVPGLEPAPLTAVVRAIYAGDARAAGVPVFSEGGGDGEEGGEGGGPPPPPTPVSVAAVLAAADYLAVPWLAAACLDAVRSALGPGTCLPALGLAATYGGEAGADGGALYHAALALAEARFGDLLAAALSSDGGRAGCGRPPRSPARHDGGGGAATAPTPSGGLSALPRDAALRLLSSDALAAVDEWEVLAGAGAWLGAQIARAGGAGGQGEDAALAAAAADALACARLDPGDVRSALAAAEEAAAGGASDGPDAPRPARMLAALPPRARAALRAAAEAAGRPGGGRPGSAAPSPPPPARPPPHAPATPASSSTARPAAPARACRGGPRGGGARLLAVGGHDEGWRPVVGAEVYDPTADGWAPGPRWPPPGGGGAGGPPLPFATGTASRRGGLAFVVGGGGGTRSVAAALAWPTAAGGGGGPASASAPAASTGPRWVSLPPPSLARRHAAVACLDGGGPASDGSAVCLLVAGGRPGVGPELAATELFTWEGGGCTWEGGAASSSVVSEWGANEGGGGSPAPGRRSVRAGGRAWPPPPAALSSGAWAPGPPLTTPRNAAAAACLGGVAYVVGGQGGASTHGSVERFDPAAGGRWVGLDGRASALATPRKYAAAVAWGGRLVVAGGVDARRVRLSSVEALDPREGRWTALPPLSVARSGAGAAVCAAAGGALVVAGGTGAAGGPLDAVEALLPGAGGGWVPRAPLGVPRSGLALVAL